MDIGETVVVGTSRLSGNSKALIALLTAVPQNPIALHCALTARQDAAALQSGDADSRLRIDRPARRPPSPVRHPPDHRGVVRAASGRRHRAALQGRLSAAGRDDPVGAVHRRAGQPGHAGAVQALPERGGAGPATTDELEPQIESTGFFRAKSKSLTGMATALVAEHGGEVPATMEELVDAAGRRPQDRQRRARPRARRAGLPVDRHVLRVSNRIGIARSDDPGGRRDSSSRRRCRRRSGRARRTR